MEVPKHQALQRQKTQGKMQTQLQEACRVVAAPAGVGAAPATAQDQLVVPINKPAPSVQQQPAGEKSHAELAKHTKSAAKVPLPRAAPQSTQQLAVRERRSSLQQRERTLSAPSEPIPLPEGMLSHFFIRSFVHQLIHCLAFLTFFATLCLWLLALPLSALSPLSHSQATGGDQARCLGSCAAPSIFTPHTYMSTGKRHLPRA